MPNLIDYTYFDGGVVNIAQTDQLAVQEQITAYIAQFEPEFMADLLGYEFYQQFLTDIAEQRMIDILTGITYTYGGKQYRWNGLTYIIGSGATAVKISPIANYVYWHILRDNAEMTFGIGTGTTTSENSTRTSPIRLQVKAWNNMVEMIIQLRDFLNRHPDEYPEYDKTMIKWFHWQNEFNL